MNDPNDEQREIQTAFFHASYNDALDTQSESVRTLLDELGLVEESDRVRVSLAIAEMLGPVFSAGWKAGMVEAAAQAGANINDVDSDRDRA